MSISDREAIKRVFEVDYAENMRTKNLKGYGEMYTEDALWMAPNIPDRQGRKEIEEGFTQLVAKQDIEPQFTADEIEVMSDFGYVIGVSIAKIYPLDGSPPKESIYKALWLMKKEGKDWKISRQIWNNKPL
ncbi:MAG: SgcJ/EcaC family oxidoreductase [Cyanobacteria bacterium J06621_8]